MFFDDVNLHRRGKTGLQKVVVLLRTYLRLFVAALASTAANDTMFEELKRLK